MVNMTPISDRPAQMLERVELGHWEGEVIAGSANTSAIVTLVERTSDSIHTLEDLDAVAAELNDRPRKRLQYAKPSELINELLLR